MSLERTVLEAHVRPTPRVGDLVLNMDNSFMTKLSRFFLGQVNTLLVFLDIARAEAAESNRKWWWYAPPSVIKEYEYLPRHYGLKELMHPDRQIPPFQAEQRLIDKAEAIWENYLKDSHTETELISRADLEVIASGFQLKEQGLRVYTASSDIIDIINPLRRSTKKLSSEGLDTVLMPPSPVQMEYFERAGLRFEAVLTESVVEALQKTKITKKPFVVIFQTGVKSGYAKFDLGIRVEQIGQRKSYGYETFLLPQEYRRHPEVFTKAPVLYLNSLDVDYLSPESESLVRTGVLETAERLRSGLGTISMVVVASRANPNLLHMAAVHKMLHRKAQVGFTPIFIADRYFLRNNIDVRLSVPSRALSG